MITVVGMADLTVLVGDEDSKELTVGRPPGA